MLTVEFSKMYYIGKVVPTLSLEQETPVLEIVGNISFYQESSNCTVK
jgi:hypothetical protein